MTKPQVGLLQCAAEKEYLPVQAQISDTPHLLLLMKRIFFRDTAGGDHHKLKTARDGFLGMIQMQERCSGKGFCVC